jgi:hypothetical protein
MDEALRVIQEANPELTPVAAVFELKDMLMLCTVKLHNNIMALDMNPRPDLLAPWIGLLQSYNMEWAVNLAAAKLNKDKHLWVSLS